MSLKALHIVFVTASVALAVFLAAWCFISYSSTGSRSDLVWGWTSVASVVALLCYGKYVLRKLKHISYL